MYAVTPVDAVGQTVLLEPQPAAAEAAQEISGPAISISMMLLWWKPWLTHRHFESGLSSWTRGLRPLGTSWPVSGHGQCDQTCVPHQTVCQNARISESYIGKPIGRRAVPHVSSFRQRRQSKEL